MGGWVGVLAPVESGIVTPIVLLSTPIFYGRNLHTFFFVIVGKRFDSRDRFFDTQSTTLNA